MGILEQIDLELQKDLVNFVKEQEEKPWPHTLGDAILVEILKDIIKGDARISGSCTNHKKKRMYLEISFYEGENQTEETEDEQISETQD